MSVVLNHGDNNSSSVRVAVGVINEMKNIILERVVVPLVVVGLLGIYARTANAQAIEEVIVTAQKREERIQDIPISITAFSGETVRKLGFENAQDIARNTTGLTVKPTIGDQNPVFTIRGVGLSDPSPNNMPNTSMYVDEVLVAFTPMMSFQLFDLERIEVLKGPQGTLYGRNNTAGAISVVTKKPTHEFGAYGQVDYGSYDTVKFQGAVGGSLTETLAARISVNTMQRLQGYQHNRTTNDDHATVNNNAGRIQFLWTPNDSFDALASFHGSYDDSETPFYEHSGFIDRNTGQTPCAAKVLGEFDPLTCVDALGFSDPDGDPFTGDAGFRSGGSQRPGTGGAETFFRGYGAALVMNMDMARGAMTSVTGYDRFYRDQDHDQDATAARYVDVHWENEIEAFSQEVRFHADDSWLLDWLVGAFYSQDKIHVIEATDSTDFLGVLTNAPVDLGWFADTHFNQKSESFALFAHGEYEISPSWSFSGGIRYTHEKREWVGGSSVTWGRNLFGPFPVTGGDLTFADSDITVNDVSGEAALLWQATDDVMMYAKFSKGFKSGGWAGTFTNTNEQLKPFQDETLYAYEAGFKSTLLDGTLQFNSSVYFYDWRDFQAFIFEQRVVPVNVLTNAGDAEILGAEVEITWRPIKGLELNLAGNWNDAEVVKDNSISQNLLGKTPAQTPDFALNGLVRYTHSVSIGSFNGSMAWQTDFNWQDDVFYTLPNDAFAKEDAYAVVNARVSIQPDGARWEIALWGRNIFDKEYIINVLDGTNFSPDLRWYGMPAQFGVSVKYDW